MAENLLYFEKRQNKMDTVVRSFFNPPDSCTET